MWDVVAPLLLFRRGDNQGEPLHRCKNNFPRLEKF